MKRVVIIDAGAEEQEWQPRYAQQAYEQSLWELINGEPMDSPPTPDQLLEFAMQSGQKQQRLWAARVPSNPPTTQAVLNGIFRNRFR